MWAFSRREEPLVSASADTKVPKFLSRNARSRNRNNSRQQRSDNVIIGASLEGHQETVIGEGGIEVSLQFLDAVESREPYQKSRREPVIDITRQIELMKRVHRNYFSLAFPALDTAEMNLNGLRPRGHRIPLIGTTGLQVSYLDALNILQNSRVTTEHAAVSQELDQINIELTALEKDRILLQNSFKNAESPSASMPALHADDWDIHRLLLQDQTNNISENERRILQRKRGDFLTFHFQSYKTKEVFLSKCEANLPLVKSNKRRAPGDTITLGTHNSKSGGAAIGIQHIALTSNTKVFKTGFFFSFDSKKSQNWGMLPNKLFRRIKDGTGGHHISDLVYLSTGPQGSYYAEFRSGDCWWGSPVEDDDFHFILQDWDVHRVVFGPIDAFEDQQGDIKITNSWIIIGKNGRVAWKNIPTRLHNRLENRLSKMAAPSEVSLGPGGSFFIRFLDGTVDYCLPAEIAEVCERIELLGGEITDITLHPEISHDFVIRHTALGAT